MAKISGRFSSGLVWAAVLVVVNIIGVALVMGQCPNVTVINARCDDQEDYDKGTCRVGAELTISTGQWVYYCNGGKLSVDKIDKLKFDSPGMQIVSNEFAPCCTKIVCGTPQVVADGSEKDGDLVKTALDGTVTRYRCFDNVTNETAIGLHKSSATCHLP